MKTNESKSMLFWNSVIRSEVCSFWLRKHEYLWGNEALQEQNKHKSQEEHMVSMYRPSHLGRWGGGGQCVHRMIWLQSCITVMWLQWIRCCNSEQFSNDCNDSRICTHYTVCPFLPDVQIKFDVLTKTPWIQVPSVSQSSVFVSNIEMFMMLSLITDQIHQNLSIHLCL